MRSHHRAAILAAAVTVVFPLTTLAGVTGGAGREFVLPTTGATALRAFTSAENFRGPYLVGTNAGLRVGASDYTIDTAAGQAYGILNKNSTPGASDPPQSADRIVYQYHSTGSINGVREAVRAAGLLNVNPFSVQGTNQLFVMGQPLTSLNGAALTNGYNSSVGSSYNPLIAYSDVDARQGFAVSGTPALGSQPATAGYGLGRPNAASGFSGNNYQRLTSVDSLDDVNDATPAGVETLTSRVRSEQLAAVPFTVSASTGTGLGSLNETDVKFLQAAGRLQNGANFNWVNRDIGSGTRNQSANNVNLDPSWSSGERDRRAFSSYTSTDIDGNTINVAIGEEANPERGVNGASSVSQNEHRASAFVRFSDKTSGSTGVRQTVLSTRMSLGTISVGDVGSRGTSVTSSTPLRVLAIDWNEDPSATGEPVNGPVQPTFANVIDGSYQMWSAAVAVSVSPDGTTVQSTDAIKNDIDDEALAGGASGPGLARKFLDNIFDSIGTGPNPTTAATPFDAILNQGFIPVGLLGVEKDFDGAPQSARTRNATEESIFQAILGLGTGSPVVAALNFVPAASHNGGGTQTYGVFDVENTSSAGSPDANVKITLNDRIRLAGDFNGDGVRDLADVDAMAQAYSNTAAFLAANPAITTTVNTAANGAAGRGTLVWNLTPEEAALLVISDLNGDGNVKVRDASNNVVPESFVDSDNNGVADYAQFAGGGNDSVDTAVDIDDVEFFLFGAAIDTVSANPSTGYAGSNDAATRRDLGVRQGQLKKNEAVIRFNQAVGSEVFSRFDVNRDGVVDRTDAKIVNDLVGSDIRDLDDVLATPFDLVRVELNDDNVITHIDPNTSVAFDLSDEFGNLADLRSDSDFQQVRGELGSLLLDGDTNFDGTVDFPDLLTLAQNYDSSVDRWSLGDFNFDGQVEFADLLPLAQNFGSSALSDGTILVDQAMASSFDTQWALARSLVPEPTTLVLAGGAVAFMARRRRA